MQKFVMFQNIYIVISHSTNSTLNESLITCLSMCVIISKNITLNEAFHYLAILVAAFLIVCSLLQWKPLIFFLWMISFSVSC